MRYLISCLMVGSAINMFLGIGYEQIEDGLVASNGCYIRAIACAVVAMAVHQLYVKPKESTVTHESPEKRLDPTASA